LAEEEEEEGESEDKGMMDPVTDEPRDKIVA
jgi:hypothetical protein